MGRWERKSRRARKRRRNTSTMKVQTVEKLTVTKETGVPATLDALKRISQSSLWKVPYLLHERRMDEYAPFLRVNRQGDEVYERDDDVLDGEDLVLITIWVIAFREAVDFKPSAILNEVGQNPEFSLAELLKDCVEDPSLLTPEDRDARVYAACLYLWVMLHSEGMSEELRENFPLPGITETE